MNRVSAPVAPASRTTASRLTASKYSSNIARSWPPSASPNSLDHGLQVHLQTRSITASECISEFTRSQCGETVVVEGSQPVINILPHLAWRPNGHLETERFWLKQHRMWVRRYDTTRPRGSTQLRGSTKSWKELVRSKDGKDWIFLLRGLPNLYSLSLSPFPLFLYLRMYVCMYVYRET